MKFATCVCFLSLCSSIIGASASEGEQIYSPMTCNEPDTKVLILGAGMSGIAAAYSLQVNKTADFIILEAQDRIGGRMRTENFGGTNVNLGAAWMQGVSPEHPEKWPLWWLKEKCGIQGFFDGITNSLTVFNEQGANITGSSSLRWDDWNAAYNRSVNISLERQKRGQPDITVRDALDVSGWLPRTAEDKFVEWMGFDFCDAESPNTSSLFYSWPDDTYIDFGSPNSSGTGYYVNDTRGYAGMADCLAGLVLSKEDQRLHLNTTVTKIQWSDSQKCVCATAMEDGVEKMYCAPDAILTFSLGVLQSENFQNNVDPPLPTWKLDAIKGTEIATYLKVFVEFETSFWSNVRTHYIGRADTQKGNFVIIENFAEFFEARPNILTFTVLGPQAFAVYNQSINATREELVNILRTIFGDNVTKPLRVFFPDWHVNPLFLGTYSSAPFGVTDEVYVNLAKPVGTLHFSGEATDPDFFGYVHGAYFQGIRAANEITNRFTTVGETSGSVSVVSRAVLVALVATIIGTIFM